MAAAIWADPAHHTVAGLISIRELATVTALIDNERRGGTRGAAIRWDFLRVGNDGSRRFGPPPVPADVFHSYSDMAEDGIEVLAYDYVEAFAEKFRALAERTRPRDLYDVANLYRNADCRADRVLSRSSGVPLGAP
ncbi:nucleotidyl transferase AbiEii/AbiGii toxin family protein [Bradyrhizobium zhanjiangense]|uniref:nucleotidyl transferase AbiEii/AbiGii toxin family protein n=1 Tax=Bradyrhizobium zhanjiangense TaxID=1325107 RepID=UPI001008EF18